MYCFNCGCRLSEHDFCTSCGVDVARYKKIIYASNMYYNDGLAKARVRDLSGAVVSLRQSLKFNKNNVEARNLLGLVYFEMGESVAALCEWIISKNLKAEKNIADDYINMIQSSASQLENIKHVSKKYNQALAYCQQESKDLALIQLRKVLSMNQKFIRAHLLLALLYMDIEQWEKAKREVNKVLSMDRNNTQALVYQREIERMLNPEDGGKPKKKQEDAIRYQSDNEVIIQPIGVKEPKRSGAGTLLNIGIGLLIGAAAVYFLVVPAARTNAKQEAQTQVTEIGNQIDVKNTTIKELENEIKDLEAKQTALQGSLDGYAGTEEAMAQMEELLNIASRYLAGGDLLQTADELEQLKERIVPEEASNAFQNLYNALRAYITPLVVEQGYEQGYSAYSNGDNETAATALGMVVKYDETHADAWFYLGRACHKLERNDEAIAAYTKVVELVPGTERAANAQTYIGRLSGN